MRRRYRHVLTIRPHLGTTEPSHESAAMSTFPGRRFPAPLLPRAGVEFTGGPSVHELLGSWWQADAGCLGTDPDAWFQPAEGQDAGDAGVDPCAASRLSGSRPRRPAICGVAAGADDRDARGEILGLWWSDLDLDVGRVAVRRPRIVVDYQVQVSEPKTAKGRRSLARDPVTEAALRAHRVR
jgi:hypothetical protein